MSYYEQSVQNRNKIHYYKGLIVRWINYLRFEKTVKKARKKGAIIGEGVIMTPELGNKLNHNFVIGNHVSLHCVKFSSNLHKVQIGNHVIIGDGVKVIRGSHNIDSPDFENISKNETLVIEDYVWLCNDCVITPSVKKIGYGAVIGANAVVVKDVEPMAVVGGNPAKEIRKRECVHSNLVVESLLGGDYLAYKDAWKNRK